MMHSGEKSIKPETVYIVPLYDIADTYSNSTTELFPYICFHFYNKKPINSFQNYDVCGAVTLSSISTTGKVKTMSYHGGNPIYDLSN